MVHMGKCNDFYRNVVLDGSRGVDCVSRAPETEVAMGICLALPRLGVLCLLKHASGQNVVRGAETGLDRQEPGLHPHTWTDLLHRHASRPRGFVGN